MSTCDLVTIEYIDSEILLSNQSDSVISVTLTSAAIAQVESAWASLIHGIMDIEITNTDSDIGLSVHVTVRVN